MASSMDELKKLKKENGKQRTVIEWLESELASTKDEKFSLQNKLNSVEQRIHSLLRHKGELKLITNNSQNFLEQNLKFPQKIENFLNFHQNFSAFS